MFRDVLLLFLYCILRERGGCRILIPLWKPFRFLKGHCVTLRINKHKTWFGQDTKMEMEKSANWNAWLRFVLHIFCLKFLHLLRRSHLRDSVLRSKKYELIFAFNAISPFYQNKTFRSLCKATTVRYILFKVNEILNV